MDANDDNPGVIAFPPLLWLVNAGIGGVLRLFYHWRIATSHLALGIGVVLVIVGIALVAWARRMMHAAGTNVDPSEPALTIVRSGPYRFTRNPMYLALCLLQVALGFLMNDWLSVFFFVPLALVLHYGVILREEKYLAAKFGETYLELKRRVRRWC